MLEQKITFDKFIRWSLIVACVFVVLFTVNYLSQVLLPFFIAWFFAYLLYPAVKFVQDKLHVNIHYNRHLILFFQQGKLTSKFSASWRTV